jgi:NTE family protein
MVFHLGALQRLNEFGVLRRLKRISSVSGGSITAAALGMNWKRLEFDSSTGVAGAFDSQLVAPVRQLASRTIDETSVIGGILLPGSVSDKVAGAYDNHLFHGATLADLPLDSEGPRFVINATNVQTGSLWRFSKPYMGDYQVGLINDPRVSLAKAVAASSAFPPVLSPCELDVKPADFDPTTRGNLFVPPYNDEIVLTDGGVYDNLGLETAYKRYTTILVSDAGQAMAAEPEPKGDWARHSIRVLGLIDNQVRSLRKRQLITAFQRGDRTGTYWSVASHFADYAVPDPLGIAGADTSDLARLKTRLKRMDDRTQEQLINWGYAICDAAIRKHCIQAFADFGITITVPTRLPYPGAGL